MSHERELLMIPGPTMVSPRVLRILAKPVLSHVSKEFVDGFAEALELQKKLFVTEGTPFMLSGSGTLGMEAAIANLVEKGDKVLFGKYAGTEIKIDSEEHLIMREDDIIAIVE